MKNKFKNHNDKGSTITIVVFFVSISEFLSIYKWETAAPFLSFLGYFSPLPP